MHETSYRDNAVAQVSEWEQHIERFEFIADITQSILEGLAYGRLNDQFGDERTRNVLDFASELMVEMLDESQTNK